MIDEEASFEAWFQRQRRITFARDMRSERLEDHPKWSMGLRSAYRDAWMARANLNPEKKR